MFDHWKSLLEHLPIVTMATGNPRIDWGSIINIVLTGAVSGIIASQVMVVRLEERVANQERRLAQCETGLAEHVAAVTESSAKLRERIATCEAKIK